MAEELKQLIQGHFDGARADLEDSPDGRVFGSVVWAGFEGLDHADRQQAVRGYLRQRLGPGMGNVALLLMYAPNKSEIMQAA